ncbi:MAG: glycosyltransferase family A protein [Patescibacteria group bacterium]
MKRISVIIATYQHAQTLGSCLESLFAQTRKPDEVIVVDDGSTDTTKEVVNAFGDQVNYFFQENQGAPSARNFGMKQVTGDYVLFCDADVIAHPSMLEKMERALETHPEAAYAYSGMRFGHKRFRSQPFSVDKLRKQNYIHTTSLIRTEVRPRFDESIKRFQDWDLWLTLLEEGKHGVGIEEELFVIRSAPGRKGISQWVPSFLYRVPWPLLGWKPAAIRRYDDAKEIVQRKHHL